MKEFSSQTGGRFTYVDDVLNLQELSLAFAAIFDDCDNFIISGCEVVNNTISPGIIYLNGKLRIFNGASGITVWPQYLYEVNTTENTPYQSGGEKVGRNVWGCAAGSVVPTTLTPLTNKIPQSIRLTTSGGLRMKDAWIGKYALLLDPANSSQTIKGTVTADNFTALAQLIARQRMSVATSGGAASLYYEGSNMILESSVDNGATKYKFVASHGTGGFQLYKNTTLLATFTDSQITFAKPVSSTQGTFGSIRATGTQLYNSSTSSDSGELSINMLGLNGGSTYYRNTYIGNGKGVAIISVIGKTGEVTISGGLTLSASAEEGLVLVSNKAKTDVSLKKQIIWQDSAKALMGVIGFADLGNQVFYLTNSVGGVKITGTDSVDLGPAIKENGTLLSEKYVLKTVFDTAMSKKMDSTSVYTQTQCNQRFSTLAGGLVQFVSQTKSKATLCQEIGALTSSDLANYIQKDKFLSEMATSDENKKKIRDNIGAAGIGDFQAKLSDTNWVKITGNLYARQIGNIVCIQGTITTSHDGTVFTLPNNINAPRYAVGYDAPMPDGCYWSCKIDSGSKSCVVTRCNHHGFTIPISFTYMI